MPGGRVGQDFLGQSWRTASEMPDQKGFGPRRRGGGNPIGTPGAWFSSQNGLGKTDRAKPPDQMWSTNQQW
jgi:hypothetical protein